MNMDNATQLNRIYNTLLLIKTSGEDTVLMGKCLEAFKNTLTQIKIDMPEGDSNISQEV